MLLTNSHSQIVCCSHIVAHTLYVAHTLFWGQVVVVCCWSAQSTIRGSTESCGVWFGSQQGDADWAYLVSLGIGISLVSWETVTSFPLYVYAGHSGPVCRYAANLMFCRCNVLSMLFHSTLEGLLSPVTYPLLLTHCILFTLLYICRYICCMFMHIIPSRTHERCCHSFHFNIFQFIKVSKVPGIYIGIYR